MSVFLAPHNDDETLFGAYTLLQHRPLVVVCLRSYVEAGWPNGPSYDTRERETAAACQLLGCGYEQWSFRDDDPPWNDVAEAVADLHADRVWAPLPEPGGHPHHNAIGEIASRLYPSTVFYATYRRGGDKTTTGTLVEPEPGWEELKRRAMGCYLSQASHPNTHLPFDSWPTDEYLTEATVL